MRFILDSCVGLKWIFEESGSDKAQKLRDDYRSALIELLAPDVFPVEFTHAVTRAERMNRITPAEGAEYIEAMFPTRARSLSDLIDDEDALPDDQRRATRTMSRQLMFRNCAASAGVNSAAAYRLNERELMRGALHQIKWDIDNVPASALRNAVAPFSGSFDRSTDS